MDKETYIKRISELDHIMAKAYEYNRKEREKATKSYISENCPFKAGEKVTYNGNPGTIFAIRVTSEGYFEYDFRPNKKDGKPSQRLTTVYWCDDGLEKA